jgi:branched-chain amino acid transport system ATP-binding protein
MSRPILQAVNVTKRYGKFTAVNGITLDIEAGTVHSVIGPNGAGKTTLFHTLTGTTPITEGASWSRARKWRTCRAIAGCRRDWPAPSR